MLTVSTILSLPVGEAQYAELLGILLAVLKNALLLSFPVGLYFVLKGRNMRWAGRKLWEARGWLLLGGFMYWSTLAHLDSRHWVVQKVTELEALCVK